MGEHATYVAPPSPKSKMAQRVHGIDAVMFSLRLTQMNAD
jgi:hypothetical protein